MLAYVTGLYAIRENYLPQLYQHFQQLIVHLSAPLYIFVDSELPFPVPSSVHVIHMKLDAFDTYQKCKTSAGRLPEERNMSKDTEDFMALMNTKVEMLWRALPYIKEDISHIAWIDAGILKILREPSSTYFEHHLCVKWPSLKVAMPGCQNLAAPSSDRICWRFCGGFFVVPTSILTSFYFAVTSMLESWLRAGHLVWEVNIWAALEWAEPAWFAWWAADHNERMFTVPSWLTTC